MKLLHLQRPDTSPATSQRFADPPNVSFQSHITKQKAKPLKKFHEKPPPLVTQEDLLIFFHQFTAQKANL